MIRTNGLRGRDFFSADGDLSHRAAAPSLVQQGAQQGKMYPQVQELLPAVCRLLPSAPLSLRPHFPHH